MNINQLRREAVLAAEDVLADLDLADGTKIPIFDLIEDRGIWLSFQPLERLLGVYQRIGNVAGVAINVARPLAMQRFTAAHELGHHELGHESHVDDETSIEGSSNDPQELQAQTFAASLLMSEVAVEAHLMKIVPRERWTRTTDLLIFHGRRICDARRPRCGRCPLFDVCRFPARADFAARDAAEAAGEKPPKKAPARRR